MESDLMFITILNNLSQEVYLQKYRNITLTNTFFVFARIYHTPRIFSCVSIDFYTSII